MNSLKFFTLQFLLSALSISVQLFAYEYNTKLFNLPTILVITLNVLLITLLFRVFNKFGALSILKRILLTTVALLLAGISIGLFSGDIQFY